MKSLKTRLTALEQAERTQPARDERFTRALMFSYATDDERGEWEAAERPAETRAEWEAAITEAYQ